MDNKPHTPPVLAAEFSNERDAAIACGMLQANGVEAFVVDDAWPQYTAQERHGRR